MLSENVGYTFMWNINLRHGYSGSQLFVRYIEKNTYKIIKSSNSNYIVDGYRGFVSFSMLPPPAQNFYVYFNYSYSQKKKNQAKLKLSSQK